MRLITEVGPMRTTLEHEADNKVWLGHVKNDQALYIRSAVGLLHYRSKVELCSTRTSQRTVVHPVLPITAESCRSESGAYVFLWLVHTVTADIDWGGFPQQFN